MRNLFIFLLIILFSPSAFGQDAARVEKTNPPVESKTPPAEITISADIALKLQNGAQRAEIKLQEAEILALRIKEANVELERLRAEGAKLQQEANSALAEAAVKAGIPAGEVRQYEWIMNLKGEMLLRRKPHLPPPSPRP